MDETARFEAERPRLLRIAGRVLGDPMEAEDIVQQSWLRLHGTDADVANLPGWLSTVVTRLCLDRLRARTPVPTESSEAAPGSGRVGSPDAATTPTDPADHVALADTVGVALQVVLDRLTPGERVAFVLHDTFGFEFTTIAAILDTTPGAARKLASRARAKVRDVPTEGGTEVDRPADWEVVDAFLTAARGGDVARLLRLLAPDVVVTADPAAVASGTPERLAGQRAVATMFNGAAKAALPVLIGERPGAAWFHRGEARVLFDFTVEHGVITRIVFRAEADVLARVVRRTDGRPA
ncbi:MAG: sigma-70 family RNA polymerase sigma factor [Ornithinibacter sp.]